MKVPTRHYVMEQAEEWGGGEGGALVQVVNASMLCIDMQLNLGTFQTMKPTLRFSTSTSTRLPASLMVLQL